jgi:sucrose synthase
VLNDRNKPIIFSMARLDRVKNLTGLVELYGRNKRLQELVNLVVVCGDHGNPSKDKEEQAEFKKMFDLIEQYNLNGHIRWISAQMNRVRNGELYRYICDTKGAFVQVKTIYNQGCSSIHVLVAKSFVLTVVPVCAHSLLSTRRSG